MKLSDSRGMKPWLSRAVLVTALVTSGLVPLAARQAAAPRPAAQPAQTPLALADRIPLDPAVHTGTLPNGLTYYVRQNPRPANRVSLRLAVKAGSLDEADDQQGLAHMLEHMAFNGSDALQAGRSHLDVRSRGRQARPARQRLYELRRDRLHARSAVGQARPRHEGLHGVRGFRGRVDARSERNRQGARRRDRGVARRPRRRSRACATRKSPSSFITRASPTGCRSARSTSCGRSRRRVSARSTTRTTALRRWRSSRSATWIRRRSNPASRPRSAG